VTEAKVAIPELTPEQWAANDRRVRELEAEAEAERARERDRLRRVALDRLGVAPKARAVAEAGSLQDTPARASLRGLGTFLVLSGGAGCGKTVAAAEWLLGKGHGLWLSASALARWKRYDEAEMRRLCDAPALVVDDLGTEYLDDKGNFLALFDELINERYEGARPTVFTTNLAVDAFRERYGARIISRLAEVGRFVTVDGPDLRRRP
jgi:DNA replication protein DnaC